MILNYSDINNKNEDDDTKTVPITILVPAYNEELWISQALNSIKNQTLKDFTVIIYDNASTDSTPKICKEICLNDRRFSYFRHEKNLGAAKNCKLLLENIKTDFFMILGAHDCIEKDFLKTHVTFLENNPKYTLSYGNITNINERNEVIGYFEPPNYEPLITAKQPAKRYLQAITQIPKGVLVNHVIRRSAVESEIIVPITGSDHVFTAFTAGTGKWKKHNNAMYHRRYFIKRDENYLHRITGKASKKNRSDYEMVKYMVRVLNEYYNINLLQKTIYSVYLIISVTWRLFKIRKIRKYYNKLLRMGRIVLQKIPWLNRIYRNHLKKYITRES